MNSQNHPLSLTGKLWHKLDDNDSLTTQLLQSCGVSEIIARLLAQKNFTPTQAQEFLTPKLKTHLPDPFHLLDMDKAVMRIIQAITAKEQIYIFGDYDVDGATSSSLLKRFFQSLGCDVGIYIPDRIKEGYGPNSNAMKELHERNAKVIITVDCGATSYEAVNTANELGMDIIILDHHLGSEELPAARAVVNPNRLDQETEYTHLAAVGVCFLFCIAALKTLREKNFFHDKEEPNLLALLDLVALGTICDVMPVSGLNRAFVSQGLKVAMQRQNTGLRALIDMCGIDQPLSCYHLGFMLGPRINAGGRVGKSDYGARLLSSNNMEEAAALAHELNNFNNDRQAIEATLLDEAIISAQLQKANNIICISGEAWHQGVIGIIASRVKENVNKPTMVISFDGDIGKASCRSVRGFNLGKLVIDAREAGLLVAGGGHGMAAGFTIHREKLDEFMAYIQTQSNNHDFSDTHIEHYHAELALSATTLDLAHELEKLAPFGPGNAEPIFRIENVSLKNLKIIKDKHVSALVVSSYQSNTPHSIRAMAFNMASDQILPKLSKPNLTIVGNLKINHWQGRQSVQLIIKDIIA